MFTTLDGLIAVDPILTDKTQEHVNMDEDDGLRKIFDFQIRRARLMSQFFGVDNLEEIRRQIAILNYFAEAEDRPRRSL